MYSFDSYVRYSEIGQDGRLNLDSVVDYFQDCSMFHSESCGIGVDFLEQHKQGWFIASWQIIIHELPLLGDKIKISTWPYEFKGFWGKRNFVMEDENGTQLACANSLWTFMNMETLRPMRVTQEQIDGYPIEEKLDMDYASRKIELSDDGVAKEPVCVSRSRIDTNHHMNNSQYVKVALDYIPLDFITGQIRVEYRKPAMYQDVVIPVLYQSDTAYTVSLKDVHQETYATIEFQKK